MKTTISFIIRTLALAITLIPTSLNGQTYEQKTASGQVYQIRTKPLMVANKNNVVNWKNMGDRCYFYSVEDGDSDVCIDKIVKTYFSEERLKKLAHSKKILTIIFFCNRNGQVVNLEFLLSRIGLSSSDELSLSLEDLEKMEKDLLKLKIPLQISPDCTNKYYVITKSIRFKDFL